MLTEAEAVRSGIGGRETLVVAGLIVRACYRAPVGDAIAVRLIAYDGRRKSEPAQSLELLLGQVKRYPRVALSDM